MAFSFFTFCRIGIYLSLTSSKFRFATANEVSYLILRLTFSRKGILQIWENFFAEVEFGRHFIGRTLWFQQFIKLVVFSYQNIYFITFNILKNQEILFACFQFFQSFRQTKGFGYDFFSFYCFSAVIFRIQLKIGSVGICLKLLF